MTNEQHLRIALLDDNAADAEILRRSLDRIDDMRVEFLHFTDTGAGEEALLTQPFDCLFLDYSLGSRNGLQVLSAIRNAGNDVATILLTGAGNEQIAVEAMKRGAQDYLVKDVMVRGDATPRALRRTIANAMYKVKLERSLAETQQEVEQYASVVAHDLKSPICAVRNNLEVLRDFYGARMDEPGREFLTTSLETLDRMGRLIDVLLAYSLLGHDAMPAENVDLNEVARAALTHVEIMVEQAGARITVDEPLPTVRGDRVLLTQLFQNLISNGVKFRRAAPPTLRIAAEQSGDGWTLSFADNGIGIAVEDQRRVFAPFCRLHSRRRYEGSGIGLASVRRICELHDVRVWLTSEVGKGTTVHLGPFEGAADTEATLAPAAD